MVHLLGNGHFGRFAHNARDPNVVDPENVGFGLERSRGQRSCGVRRHGIHPAGQVVRVDAAAKLFFGDVPLAQLQPNRDDVFEQVAGQIVLVRVVAQLQRELVFGAKVGEQVPKIDHNVIVHFDDELGLEARVVGGPA